MSPVFHDHILIRIYHGNMAKPKCFRKASDRKITVNSFDPRGLIRPNVGGLWGGHVAMQVRDSVYGFMYIDPKNIHWIDKSTFNSQFHRYRLEEWDYIVAEKRESVFYIPALEKELDALEQYFQKNCQQASIDYSFFGERCASNTFHQLKALGKITAGHYALRAFWPGKLRKTLLREAAKQQWAVSVKEGCSVFWWEGNIRSFPLHPWLR